MEKQIFSLNAEDFAFFHEKMIGMGWRETGIEDQKKLFRRLGIFPPRKIIGRETTYSYINHGYTAVVHTTYLKEDGKWRDSGTDAGWVLIRKGDEAVYFARPFQRKKGFILKILRYAWVTKWKVDNRPLCPECDSYMNIQRKKNTRQYFYMCDKNQNHKEGKPEFLPWDYLLPKKASDFVKIRREYAEKYKIKNEKEGKVRKPAPLIRKKWIITKPNNLE